MQFGAGHWQPRASGLAILCWAICTPVASSWAQQAEEATVAAAQAALSAQKPEEARDILEDVVKAEPENGQAWFLLGQVDKSLGDAEGAIAALSHAMDTPQIRPRALILTGRTYADMDDLDNAFKWLQQAKEEGQVNITVIGILPEAAKLSQDPRYRLLFPSDEEFADPFVEPTKIIHEWRGENKLDVFGWMARNVGDVDGDDVADAVVSATGFDPGNAAGAGKVYVYSGASGDLLWSVEGEGGDGLGTGIEAAGDVNCDGVPDVAAGAPAKDYLLLLSGDDGRVIHRVEGPEAPEFFGRSMRKIGDIDGDGCGDLIVGAPQNGKTAQNAGAAYWISGKSGKVLRVRYGEQAGDLFGTTVAGGGGLYVVGVPGRDQKGFGVIYREGKNAALERILPEDSAASLGGMFSSVVGDVNGDGVQDIYLSDWADGAEGPFTGRIYVYSGADGARLFTMAGETPGEGFGIGSADVGDVNGDGYDDLIVGSWQYRGAAPGGGRVVVISGRDQSILRTITGKVTGETFGFDATGMGDVDGDGHIDYLLTSAYSAVNGVRSGRTYIISGAPGQ